MTPRQALHNKRMEIAYDALCRAADAGEMSPTNVALSKLCGYLDGDCGSGANNLLQTLMRDKRIRIHPACTHGRRRIVEIVATGKCTANPPAPKVKKKPAPKAKPSKPAEKPARRGTNRVYGRIPVEVTTVTFNDPRLIAALEAVG